MNIFNPFISRQYSTLSKDDTLYESQPTFTQKTDSQYLSEILSQCIIGSSKQITQFDENDIILQKQSQQLKSNENSSNNSSSSGNKKNSSKSSPFHNFQKHLVITLRQILDLKCLYQKVGSDYELAVKIFQYFKKSQKTSRLFLEQVFGLFQNRDCNSNAQFITTIRKGQLQVVLENSDDETIIGAQCILKQCCKDELDQCDIVQCLIKRKIQKKQEFIEYINLFKKELSEGKQRKKTYKLLAKKFQKLCY